MKIYTCEEQRRGKNPVKKWVSLRDIKRRSESVRNHKAIIVPKIALPRRAFIADRPAPRSRVEHLNVLPARRAVQRRSSLARGLCDHALPQSWGSLVQREQRASLLIETVFTKSRMQGCLLMSPNSARNHRSGDCFANEESIGRVNPFSR